MRGRLGVVLVLLAACAPLACGASEAVKSAAPSEAVAHAATRTAKVETYRASFTGTTTVAGQSVEMTGAGEFDAKRKRGHMTFTSTIAGAEFDMEMVMTWPLMYMRFPPELGTQLPAGKSWVKFNVQKLGKQLGFDFEQLMQAGQADPAQSLQYLRGIADLEVVGEEEVRGIKTTHYRGVADLHRAADELPEARESIERIIELTKVERIPTDVWVGADGLVRRMRLGYDDIQLAPGQRGDMTIVTELYDFGVDVTVEEPPAGEVVDLQKLIERESS